MKIEFGQKYLVELYVDGKCSDKKYRFQPQVIKKYQKRVDMLLSATCKEDLFPFKSLGFEALQGDKEGLYSIRVDKKYRLEFKLYEQNTEPILTLCILEKLSNHYK